MLIAGIVGIVFFLLLEPSILLVCCFHLLCQLSFSVNAHFWQWSFLLIDCYIYIWYFLDCFISIIVHVRPYMRPPHLMLIRIPLLYDSPINMSVLCPIDKAPFLSIILSIDDFFCWCKAILIAGIVGIVISGIVGIVFCLFLQPSVLLMRHFYLSSQFVPLYAVLLMFPSLHIFLPLIDWSINRFNW